MKLQRSDGRSEYFMPTLDELFTASASCDFEVIGKRMRRSEITGVVLAGGKSSRMGCEKALLTLDGDTFLVRVIRTLQDIFESVIVVVDRPGRFHPLNVPIYVDIFKDCGPLGGIHTALTVAKTNTVFVASCDTPLLTPAVIFSIIKNPLQGDVVIASTFDHVQPLCGCYARSCLPTLESRLKEGNLSVKEFLQSVQSSSIAVDGHTEALMNINSQDNYKALIEAFGSQTVP
jgi:molybdopterin-guanine dinucleotide biosynthesis protein A